MGEQSPTGTGASVAQVACDAFGADGALRRALLELPVTGRRLPASDGRASARFGDVLEAGDTLLVFLRHLG